MRLRSEARVAHNHKARWARGDPASGTATPLASNLNFVAGQTVPNLVIAKVGADGKVAVYNSAGSRHIIFDVVGWSGISRPGRLVPPSTSSVTNGSAALSNLVGGTVPLERRHRVRSDTQSITINARPSDVLTFVGDGGNLPRWAIGFAKAVRPGQGGWIVSTGQGEVPTFIDVNEATGTVDFRMEPAPGLEATAYARVVPNAGGSELLFTQMQQPDMPDELFEQLVAAVGHELVALKAVLEVTCPL
jgi:hypothetical protein